MMGFVVGLKDRLARAPLACASIYIFAVLLCAYVAIISVVDLFVVGQDVNNAAGLLEKFQARASLMKGPSYSSNPTSSNASPFVEGATVTLAGASLLQRVDAAVARFGGNVVSSEVASARGRSTPNSIDAIVACDIDTNGLQNLLYDLEAGMPFIFVDQLTIQAQARPMGTASEKLHVVLGISGQWEQSK